MGRSGSYQVQSRLPLALLVARSLAWRVPRWSLSWCSNSASVDRMSQHPPLAHGVACLCERLYISLALSPSPLDSLPGTAARIASTYGVAGNGLMRGLITSCGREGLFTAGYLGIGPTITQNLVYVTPHHMACPPAKQHGPVLIVCNALCAGLPTTWARTRPRSQVPLVLV